LLQRYETLESEAQALADLWDEAGAELLRDDLERLEERASALEAELLFPAGPDAVLVTLTAGAGGADAADWCGMLTRAYHQFAGRLGLVAELLDVGVHEASRAGGFDHATLRLAGPNAAAWFASEAGVHRLTRVSPYDARERKHTTFTAVTV